MSQHWNSRAYRVTTGVLAVVTIGGGLTNLLRARPNVAVIRPLGYPDYLLTIIGGWKLLGGLAILAPGLPRLKEWAYAGIVFNMSGALFSHIASGSGAKHLAASGFATLLALASWALRPSEFPDQSAESPSPCVQGEG